MDGFRKRKTPRYQSYDYNHAGAYFITICTQNRRCILSHIVGTGVLDCPSETGVPGCPQIELTQYGEIADKYIKQLNDFYEHLSVEKYVIMPNHIHFLLWLKGNKNKTDNGQSRTPVPTGMVVRCRLSLHFKIHNLSTQKPSNNSNRTIRQPQKIKTSFSKKVFEGFGELFA